MFSESSHMKQQKRKHTNTIRTIETILRANKQKKKTIANITDKYSLARNKTSINSTKNQVFSKKAKMASLSKTTHGPST